MKSGMSDEKQGGVGERVELNLSSYGRTGKGYQHKKL